MPIKPSWGSRIFDSLNVTLLLAFALITVIPFIYVIAGSFATQKELLQRGFILFPTEYTLDAYKYIFSTPTLVRSLLVTVYITVVGTLINIFFTCMMAYPLARKDMDFRKPILMLVVFTMLFGGGMIPTFLVVKQLGMINTYWSLLIPGAISAFNLIIMRNFFQQLPDGLEESAKIDGCNDLGIFFRIVLPLSLPAIATFSLFYAVGHWNTFFGAVLYINDHTKWPIQVLLRQIVILASGGVGDSSSMEADFVAPPEQSVKMAVIVVSTLPILLVYPFLQKHFAKGVLLGSVKG
ncbi:carbohydrate ABC transporter permease [Paenibacillus mucilaginosus]|uniref:ABC transporter permease n=2 Tax=Paenibacillus mucilaginosus TaxID=61624 RepID=I0BG45_9BACL|nr:carbohydrate ABC transporter permease [Paenibacillus mucilaginosus]AEI40540.1 YtcP3 [Paenibacillus mucilaginosus KNP414]AFH61342.1 ABC transporter permease [Paenibacillus mucilaginosus K02]MCG7216319.1 carbohydrate ABC transporter permease [Paenibacillus mucilaginosus]WDM29706.1 carbohydrate ABC transporter permease [Paenibacillus mucilaginosus]